MLKKAQKDEKILIDESENLIRNMNLNKWNRYKKSAYKPIIAILGDEKPQSKADIFEKECTEYAKKAVDKIANVFTFGINSLGKGQEISSALSGLIANEQFITLISENEWEKLYAITLDLAIDDTDGLQEKAKKALKG